MAATVRPTGTVTFLFTDIEGSTQHWEQQRAAMPAALRRHDELVRRAIEANDGYVFKTVGDAFCAVFWRASDATAAAIDAQRALRAEDWSSVGGLQARMALHSGAADERDGDYFGPAVNRVARLLAVAHGGQVVVSGATTELVRGALPGQAEICDLGEHRLKDLAEAEHIWQVLAPGLSDKFPPLRSLDALPNNLPRQMTPLIGREEVVAAVEALANDSPLVTLVGPGGIGKTRVALQVGANLLEGYSDGAWFVNLAPAAHDAIIPNVIAQAFDLPESPNRRPAESLLAYLKNKAMLVILDNCEHVIEGAADIAASILQACPRVKLLATTRESLGVDGEVVYRIPSLAIPPSESIPGLVAAKAQEYGAVALFVERARGGDRSFVLTDANVPSIVEICRRLDGLALAIELAAARTRTISIQDLSEKLDERFRLLTGGRRTAVSRQQTLGALIDWSYNLLSETERPFFRALGIFSGDFSLEAATAVCSICAPSGAAVFDLLSSLADKSLMQAETSGLKTRFRLLESIRAYAREKLLEHAELEPAARAHAAAYLDLAERLPPAWESTSDEDWKPLAEAELENWRAALRWAFEAGGDLGIARRLTAALHPVWSTMASSEGLDWVRRGLEAREGRPPDDVGASLHLCAAHLEMLAQQYKRAQAAAERALHEFTKVGDRRGVALAKLFVGAARGMLGDTSGGESLLRTALAECRELGTRRYSGAALSYLAALRLRAGDVTESRRLFAETLDVLKSVGATRPAVHVMLMLAEIEFQDGNAEEAVRLVSEALGAERASRNLDNVAFDLCNLAAYLIALLRWEEALSRAREAFALARERGIVAVKLWALHHLAAIAALRPVRDPKAEIEERRRAAGLIGFVDRHLGELEMRRDFTEREEYARLRRAIDDALGADDAADRVVEGRNWSETRVTEEALLV